jgi:hypothetical protein
MLQQEGEGSWHATIPAGVRELRLVCRSACPAEQAISTDHRRLGIMVHRLELNGQAVPLETLTQGWHALEHEKAQSWRWTDGNALLPHQASTENAPLVLHGWHPEAFQASPVTGARIAA